jgi:hypothetical protein
MEDLIWNEETIRKSRSPFSIYFYLKKTNGNQEEAQKLYREFLDKNVPFKEKHNRPNAKEYWMTRGFSEEEAIIKVREFQSKPLDLEIYIEKYGEEEGLAKFNKRKENLQNRFDVEIKNVQQKLNCSYDEAYEYCCQRRRSCSPRTVDYWLNRGHSLEDAKKLVSKFSKESSPRSIYYWIRIGYTEEEAKLKVSEYQDNNSISAIMKRYGCDKFEALDIQESILEKTKKTNIQNKKSVEIGDEYAFFVYKKEVQRETKKTLRLYKDTFVKTDKSQTLDHMYSVFWGFYNDVPPKIIGSIYNLRYVSQSENSKKRSNCSITLETLLEKYENGN